MSIIASLFMVIFGLGLFIFNIAASVWAYRDALKRGNSKEYAILILVAILFFPVLGLIVYLIIRND